MDFDAARALRMPSRMPWRTPESCGRRTFSKERATFEAPEFRWDKFRRPRTERQSERLLLEPCLGNRAVLFGALRRYARPPETLPPHPYVAMEFVPGRTLHAAFASGLVQNLRFAECQK